MSKAKEVDDHTEINRRHVSREGQVAAKTKEQSGDDEIKKENGSLIDRHDDTPQVSEMRDYIRQLLREYIEEDQLKEKLAAQLVQQSKETNNNNNNNNSNTNSKKMLK